MAETGYGKERLWCRRCYERWEFVRRIVALYEEGVSWKGCRMVALGDTGGILSEWSQIIGIDAIKDGVRDMLVGGVGHFKLQIHDRPHSLAVQMPPESPLEAGGGRPFLWPHIQNNKALEEMVSLLDRSPGAGDMVGRLVRDMCQGLGVPHWLLEDVRAADPFVIEWALVTFRGNVDQWRRHIAFRIAEEVRPLISEALNYDGYIDVVWNEEWLPSGMGGYGPVYQAFRAQGILLESLARGVLDGARWLWEKGFIPRETHEDAVRWFREG